MKNLTKNQLFFALLSIVLTTLFFYMLNNCISNQHWKSIYILAFAFGALMFINGMINGYFDAERLQRIDISFRYHLITFMVVNCIHLGCVLIANSFFNFTNVFIATFFWSIGLFFHYLYSRKTIKGYAAEELFD